MIVRDSALRCAVLDGQVHVGARSSVSLEALFLGAGDRPSIEELKALDPFRFTIDANEEKPPASTGAIVRDFGDSIIYCSSDSGAVTEIFPDSNRARSLHIPTAMSFAFTQQWARHGHACVHGALLKVEGQGVLVIGLRAAGKSVISASALAADGQIVTDDYLLVGTRDNQLLGERIRRFISLRRSWAADALMGRAAGDWKLGRSELRAFLRVAPGDDRFPESARIDKIWLLCRPLSGRRSHSSLDSISHSEAYGSLVSATSPLLLGADFPHERLKLHALLSKLTGSVPLARLETGQDIVLDPKRTWRRLLA